MEASQAGQALRCSCGKLLEVPSLRGLRKLVQSEAEPVRASATPGNRPGSTAWSGLQSLLFGGGLVLLLAAVPIGGYSGYVYSRLDTSRPADAEAVDRVYEAHVDQLTPSQALDEWAILANPEHRPRYFIPGYLLRRRAADWYGSIAAGAGVAAVVALSLMGGALALGSTSKPQAKK